MIRKILSLPTLALCFTLCTALFAGCGENNEGFVTKVRWSNVKNPKYGDDINITLKAEGETFTTVGDLQGHCHLPDPQQKQGNGNP